jgi:DNA (cytosine-5)-methyltransferase 1
MRKQPVNHLHRSGPEMIVDSFAGGGGASTGIEQALGRSPDVAINHDAEALAMHVANHPHTRHYATDIFEIDPRVVCRNQPVGLAWFSPDCTHHSKARGGSRSEPPERNLGRWPGSS